MVYCDSTLVLWIKTYQNSTGVKNKTTAILGLSLHVHHGIESMRNPSVDDFIESVQLCCLERNNAWNHAFNPDALDRPTSLKVSDFSNFIMMHWMNLDHNSSK